MDKRKEGKKFEQMIAESCPDYILVKKLASPASGWNKGDKSSFTISNECDFIMHNEKTGTFYGLELKSTELASMTFWREDIEKEHPGTHFIIGKKQILGLQKWANTHRGIYGFILNFRKKNNSTFFIPVLSFIEYTSKLTKKSINIKDIKNMGGIKIHSKIMKVNYKYDMDSFFNSIELVNE